MKLRKVLLFLLVALVISCSDKVDPEDLVCENPTVFFNQLDLYYNEYNGQNSITIAKLDCDICQIGVEGAEACECRNECEKEAYQIYQDCKQQDWWEQCKEYWEWEVSIGDTYSSLENECCPEAGIHENSCKQNCGEVPEPIRTPIGYTYGVEIWTSSTTILTSPPTTPANDVIVGEEFEGDFDAGINFDIGEFLDSNTISFCIETTIVILYDDGKCCMYKDRLCREL